MDQTVLSFFSEPQQDWLTFFMIIVTYCGSAFVISGLTVLTALSFYFHKLYARIIQLLLTVGGSAVTMFIIKQLLGRERPLAALYLEDTASFPSGHATLAMAFYGFIIFTAWKHNGHYLKNTLLVSLGLMILLVGLSRLYLGVHYLSDVLAGYAIGFIWILIAVSISKSKSRILR